MFYIKEISHYTILQSFTFEEFCLKALKAREKFHSQNIFLEVFSIFKTCKSSNHSKIFQTQSSDFKISLRSAPFCSPGPGKNASSTTVAKGVWFERRIQVPPLVEAPECRLQPRIWSMPPGRIRLARRITAFLQASNDEDKSQNVQKGENDKVNLQTPFFFHTKTPFSPSFIPAQPLLSNTNPRSLLGNHSWAQVAKLQYIERHFNHL